MTTTQKLTKTQQAAYDRTVKGATITVRDTHATVIASLCRKGLIVEIRPHFYGRA